MFFYYFFWGVFKTIIILDSVNRPSLVFGTQDNMRKKADDLPGLP